MAARAGLQTWRALEARGRPADFYAKDARDAKDDENAKNVEDAGDKGPPQWTSGSAYFVSKASTAYDKLNQDKVSDLNALDGLKSSSNLPGPCVNMLNFSNRTADSTNMYLQGPDWLFSNSCSAQVLKNSSSASWGKKASRNGTAVTDCTNSDHFAYGDQSVATVQFSAADPSKVALVSVAISIAGALSTPAGPADAFVEFKANSGLNKLFFNMDLTKWRTVVGAAPEGAIEGGCTGDYSGSIITAYTSDKITCQPFDFAYGTGSTADMGASGTPDTDNVQFQICTMPDQTKNCTCTYTGAPTSTNSCGLAGTQCNGCNFANLCACQCCSRPVTGDCACVSTTVDPSKVGQLSGDPQLPLVYRNTNLYFAAATSKDPTKPVICEQDSSGSHCLMFNGVVHPQSDFSKSLFAYEPSPFTDDLKTQGTVYMLPIRFSLFNVAAITDSVNPQFSGQTYLARLLNSQCAAGPTPAGSACPNSNDSHGFQFFQQMYSALARMLPATTETRYLNFRLQYYGYVAVQYYFLALFGYTGSLNTAASSRYSLFYDSDTWALSAAAVATAAPEAATALRFFQSDPGQLFSGARPVLGPLVGSTVSVRLTVPSILFPLLFTDATRATMSVPALEMLLLRLFPTSDRQNAASSSGFVPTTYFVNDGTHSADAIVNKTLTPTGSKFKVVGSDLKGAVYYWLDGVGHDGAVLVKTGGAVPADADLPGPLLAVRFSCTLQLQFPTAPSTDPSDPACGPGVADPSMTLLFYLSYLQQQNGQPMANVCNGMFADDAVARLGFAPTPAVVQWPQACEILKRQSCLSGSDRTLQFEGNEAELVNELFLSTTSPICQCLEGSNLPPQEKTRQLNAASMCFNRQCKQPPFRLDDVLNNAGDGSDCHPAKPVEPGTPYDCSQHCDEYLNVLRNNRARIDLETVDLSALSTECNFNVRELLHQPPARAQFLAALGLAAGAAPLAYGAVAAVCAGNAARGLGPAFGQSVAADKKFWVPCLVVALLMGGLVAFALTGLKGQQHCVQPHVRGGYTFPGSSCRVKGGWFWSLFGSDFSVELPQVFCGGVPQSYCEHYDEGEDDQQSCSEGSSQLCQQPGAAGLCVNTLGQPDKDRAIRIEGMAPSWSVPVLMLCTALACCSVPAGVLACWYGTPGIKNSAGRVALAVFVGVALLCASYVYMLVQYLWPAGFIGYQIGAAACGALADYPDALLSMQLPDEIHLPKGAKRLLYRRTGALQQDVPIYETTVKDPTVPLYIYDSGGSSGFAMTNTPPDPTNKAKVVVLYGNNVQSPALFLPDSSSPGSAGNQTILYAAFGKPRGDPNAVQFCGTLGLQSSCGYVDSDCPCAGGTPTQ
jgi:hypothetical protein